MISKIQILALLMALASVQVQASDPRESVVREIIKSNLHFSVHCMCRAVTDATVSGIPRKVSVKDIPVMIDLLGDNDITVRYGAEHVLVYFGDAAMPALRVAQSSGSKNGISAGFIIQEIENVKNNSK